MEKDLVTGIVYSQFDAKSGPVATTWFPSDLSIGIRDLVSLKSINLLIGELGLVPKSLAVLPFPSFALKGLIKAIEVRDPKHRGGVRDSAITLIFDEANDLIFYKYMNNFEELFEEIAKKILELEEKKAGKDAIQNEIGNFYVKINNVLDELRRNELSTKEADAFQRATGEEAAEKGFRFKVILCGDEEVGKTSIVLRFTDKAFRRTYIPTIGVNITEKQNQYDHVTIEFIIWDVAGATKFQKMRKHYYQGADGTFLVFDLTNPESFKNISRWHQDINFYINKDIEGYILGNKSDLVGERKVKKDVILELAKALNLKYIETSALSGENVEEAFKKLGDLLIKNE